MDRYSDQEKSQWLLAARITPVPKLLIQSILVLPTILTKTMVSPCALRKQTNVERSKISSLRKVIPRQWKSLDLRSESHALTRSNPTVAHQLSSFKMELPMASNSLSLNLRIPKLKRMEKAKARTRVQKMVCQQETKLSKNQKMTRRNLPTESPKNQMEIKAKAREQVAHPPRADMTLLLVDTKPLELRAKATATRVLEEVERSALQERCT